MKRSPAKSAPYVPPGSGPDLDQDVLVVVGVAFDHGQPDLLFEALELRRGLVGDLAQLGVVAILRQQLAGALEVVAERAPASHQLAGGLQLTVLAPYFGVALTVADHLGIGHLPLELGEAGLDLLDQRLEHNSTT